MAKLIVGIGESAVSNSSEDEIKTFALGSCVGLIILDPSTRSGGLSHIALPDSTVDKEKAAILPGYFADTGIPDLFQKLKKLGVKSYDKLIVKLVGGANVISEEDHFEIGKRNVTAIKKILWDMKVPITAEDVGKNIARTVRLELSTGKVFVSSSVQGEWRV